MNRKLREHLRKLTTLLFVLSTMLVMAGVLVAQTSNGTIVGVVTDPNGAVVANATVTATSNTTGETHTATSNAAGAYRMESVGTGPYTVTVKAGNFAELKVENVFVRPSVTTTANAALTIGKAETTVEVTAQPETLQTEDGAISHDISHVEITQIPIASLNPLALALTEPGVVAPTGREDFTNGVGFSVNGTRPRANNFLIEGQDNNDASIQGQALQVSNLEATQEVILQTNSYNAEFGHGGGSVSNLIYKSGTNAWHGSAFDLIQNSDLDSADAHDKSLPPPQPTKPSTRENTFGFTVGGPIKKDKMFVFGSIQWDKLRQAANGDTLTVPDAAGLAVLQGLAPGNPRLTEYLQALGGLVGATGGQGSGSEILGNSRPNVTFGEVERSGVPEPQDDTQYVVKGDWLPTSKDSLTVRYVLDRSNLTPDFFNNSGSLPCCDTQQGGSAHNAGIAFTHSFSPKVINELRVSYGRIGFTFGQTPATAANPVANGPTVSFVNLTGFGTVTGIPQGRFHNTFQYQDSVSWIKGNHSFKFGTDLARILVEDAIPFNNRGTLSYGASNTAGFSDLANFIDDFGGKNGSAAIDFGNPVINPRYFFQNYFAQDTWKMKPNFTVTYGIRYENAGTPGNSVPFPAIDPVLGASDPNFFTTPHKQKNDNNNFAPRVSFAYSPHFWNSLLGNDKTVIRAGFGMFYDNVFTNIVDNTASTTPNAISAAINSGGAGRGVANLSQQFAALTPVINQASSIDSIVDNLVAPITYQWNFDIERELPGSFVLTTSYVGTRGVRLFANDQFNPGTNNFDANGNLIRVVPTRGSWTVRDNSGDSIYHALDLKLDRRFRHGLLFRTSYTFSKLIDDASEVFTTTGSSSFPADLTLGNRGIDRGLSAFDHRHRVVVLYVYDIPKLRTTDSNFGVKALGVLVNGWQTSGSFAYQSGAPETVTDGFDANGDGQSNDRPLLSNSAAPLITFGVDPALFGLGGISPTGLCDGAVFLRGSGNCNPVTADAVHWIIPASGVGNVGRNTQVSPGLQTTTFAVQRAINLHSERHQFILRAEMLNPFNHPNTGNAPFNLVNIVPDQNDIVNPATEAFGNYPITINGSRTVRFWLKYEF